VREQPPESPVANALLRAFFGELIERYNGRPMPPEDTDLEMERDPTVGLAAFLVAYWDGEPAGCAGLRLHGALTRMYVARPYRRRGGGRVLLRAVEAAARARGMQRLRIDTRDDLVEARALYAAEGYEEVPPFNADPYAQHWFEKRLR